MTKKHDIIWLNTVKSTNDETRKMIDRLDNLSVVAAVRQTAGRGQRGNSWLSEDGMNLTFSIVMKYGENSSLPEIRAIDQSAISEITALSLTDLLASHEIDAKIKWPNDIYVGNRKICGILIENSVCGIFLSSSIIGIGLNVNQTEFDPSVPNPVSIAQCTCNTPVRPLLEEFMDIFKSYCRRYLNITGGLARLRKLYLSQMWRYGEISPFTDMRTGRRFSGIIRGMSDIGNLLVEDMEKGGLKEFAFKEIGWVL